MKFLAAFLLVTTLATAAYGQGAYLELMRQDVRAEKVAVLTEALELTDAQSATFWPIYREYELELAKIRDGDIALIKDYAAHFETMTNEKADEIIKTAFKNDQTELKLRERYYTKVKKALNPILAAKFVQVENLLVNMINLQISSQLPLVQAGTTTESAGSE